VLRQFGDAVDGGIHALAFERERLGHHSHREDAEFACDLSHYRCCAGSGAAAHAGGDEQHVCTRHCFYQLFAVLDRGVAADLGACTRTEAFGELLTEGDLRSRLRPDQRFLVGVGADELDALHPAVDHVVDRIAATATHADHFDHGALLGRLHHFELHV